MKYCPITTVTHEKVLLFPDIVEKAYDLLVSEGCQLMTLSPFYQNDFFVINGDCLENHFCIIDGRTRRTKNKSVDMIFAINEAVKEIILVELKLKCDNVNRLDKLSFRSKSESSKKALGTSILINKKYYLIFKEDKINEAKHFLFRINPKLDNDFIALTVRDLYNKFFK